MKTIKSVLIGALVALLGSSAWAAVSFNPTAVTVEVDKSVPVSLTGATGSNQSWSIQTQPSSCARASIS